MEGMLRRIAIVNRGEAAMRLVNAVQELRHEHDLDLRTIALHTQAERSALFVRQADEAVCIDEGRPADAGSPYLDLTTLERALVAARRTPPGSGGASSPSVRSSRSCASGSASCSSVPVQR